MDSARICDHGIMRETTLNQLFKSVWCMNFEYDKMQLNLPDELSLQNCAVVRHSFEIVSVFRLPSVHFRCSQMIYKYKIQMKRNQKKHNNIR